MTIPLQIDRLDWDEWNLEHFNKEHGVSRQEIEWVVRSILMFRPSCKERFVLFCQAPMGRIVAVVVGEVPNTPNVYDVFSARPANRQERKTLQQRGEL